MKENDKAEMLSRLKVFARDYAAMLINFDHWDWMDLVEAMKQGIIESGGPEQNPPPSPVSSPNEKPRLPSINPRKARVTSLPHDFKVSERVQAWAYAKGYDRLNQHLEVFILHCQAKNYQYVDWDSAFMCAIRKDWANLGPARPRSTERPTPVTPDTSHVSQAQRIANLARMKDLMKGVLKRVPAT